MIYIIDHQDSFTWNVVHQFAKFDKVFCSNYYELNNKLLDKSDVIVLSPGPGSPKDYPTTSNIYKKYKGRKKIIGICLGYQMILYNEEELLVAKSNFKSEKIINLNNWEVYKKHDYVIFNPVHTWIEYINRLIGAISGIPILIFTII